MIASNATQPSPTDKILIVNAAREKTTPALTDGVKRPRSRDLFAGPLPTDQSFRR